MVKSTIAQIRYLMSRNGSIISFYILLLTVVINYLKNVLEFRGTDLSSMIFPLKLSLLSFNQTFYDSTYILLLIQLLPILAVLPAGTSLCKEAQTEIDIYIISRIGRVKYLISRYMASFIVTFIVFLTPFLIETIMILLSFPLRASGDLSNLSLYDADYIEYVSNYSFFALYLVFPFIYHMVGILIFSLFAGLLAMFTLSVTAVIKMKYRVLAFIPVFILLNFSMLIPPSVQRHFVNLNWYDHVFLYDETVKDPLYALGSVLFLLLFTVITVFVGAGKEL